MKTLGFYPRITWGKGIGLSFGPHLFEYFQEKGNLEIYTSVRWDSVDMLSFFKSLGFDRSTLSICIKSWIKKNNLSFRIWLHSIWNKLRLQKKTCI